MKDALITILGNIVGNDELRHSTCRTISDYCGCGGVDCKDCPFDTIDNAYRAVKQLTNK